MIRQAEPESRESRVFSLGQEQEHAYRPESIKFGKIFVDELTVKTYCGINSICVISLVVEAPSDIIFNVINKLW